MQVSRHCRCSVIDRAKTTVIALPQKRRALASRAQNVGAADASIESSDSSNILLVAGDLKAGNVVTSTGDICILGRLSGQAHAGSEGDRTAVIRALQLDTQDISIGDIKAGRHVRLDQATLITCSSSGTLELRPQMSLGAAPVSHLSDARPQNAVQAGRADISSEGSADMSTTCHRGVSPMPESEGQCGPSISEKGGRHSSIVHTKNICSEKWKVADLAKLNPPAKVALFTGSYILIAGLLLLLAPLTFFTILFDQRSVAPVWIRVGGVLAALFGFYYIGAAHGDYTKKGLDSFYRATVYGRLFLVLAFCTLVVLKKSQWQLLILAGFNLFGAASMQKALLSL